MLDIPKSTETSHADGKILQSVASGVGVITFNNPDKRNAMSLEMWEGLGALVGLRDNPDARRDPGRRRRQGLRLGRRYQPVRKDRHNAAASEEYSKRSEAQRALLASYPKPTIACIRGFSPGGGMGRDADGYSHFLRQQPVRHSRRRLGIAYGYTASHLVSLVGPSWAAHHVHGHADRGCGSRADRIGHRRAAGCGSCRTRPAEIARTISGNRATGDHGRQDRHFRRSY
jgi:hypothetical protein